MDDGRVVYSENEATLNSHQYLATRSQTGPIIAFLVNRGFVRDEGMAVKGLIVVTIVAVAIGLGFWVFVMPHSTSGQSYKGPLEPLPVTSETRN